MKKNRLISALMLFVICLLSFGISAVADLTKAEILAIAKAEVPSGCRMTEADYDKENKEWECEYLTRNKKKEYEIIVDAVSGRVKRKEMENKYDKGAKCGCKSVSKKKVRASVKKLFEDAVITKVKKCKDDGYWIYRVWFHGDGYRANAEVNAATGKVIEWTKYF